MADEYGTPMGTQAPSKDTEGRRKVSQPSQKELSARIKDYESRSAGEARKSNVAGRGSSQGDKPAASDTGKPTRRGSIFDVVKDKQYRDMTASEKE